MSSPSCILVGAETETLYTDSIERSNEDAEHCLIGFNAKAGMLSKTV